MSITYQFIGGVLTGGSEAGEKQDYSAFVPGTETSGSIMTTGANWIPFSSGGGQCGIKFLLSNAAATGGFASLRIRARSDVATPVWNQYTMAGDFSASANIADYGELYGISSFAQDNGFSQSRASHWSVGLKAAMGCTGTSAGLRFALLVTDTSTTKATLGQYLVRLESSSGGIGVNKDGYFDFAEPADYTYFGNFEGTTGCVSVTGTAPANFGARIAIKVGATPMWLMAYTTSNA